MGGFENLLLAILGYSFNSETVLEIPRRIGFSLLVECSGFLLVLLGIAQFPIGIYSAVRRYSVAIMFATIICFIGLAVQLFAGAVDSCCRVHFHWHRR